MICVVYSSLAREGTSDDDVAAIVEQAETLNGRNRITGALVYDGEKFCQLLEGKRSLVEATLQRIEKDSRHHDLEVIAWSDVTDRRFPGWSMLRIAPDEFQGILEGLEA